MNIPHCFLLVGLLGLLTGCVTPEDIGYLVPPASGYDTTPVSTTPVYSPTPVYNTSPAYYTTPGYSTMTVYDGYHPGYGGPRHPHHRPPPPMVFGRDHGKHGGHGGHGGHSGHGPSTIHSKGPSTPAHGGYVYPRNSKRTPINQIKPPRQKSMPSRAPSGKGVPARGRTK